ncbi:MAG TPA: thioester reductase domain-containing protein, partial [Candidatus Obscuribacterales bacterium]
WLWPQPWPLTPSGKTDTGALVHWPLSIDAGPGAALTPGESLLADIWEKLLGQPVHDPEADFLALGGSSIQVLACVALAAETGLVLSPESFYRERRLGRIARQTGLSQALSAAELRTRLPAPLEAKSPLALNRSSGTLLLTGATGFLGSRLLAELLTQTGWKLQCLVRAASQELGWKRLEQALQPWGQVPDPARIEVLCGDLAQPDLGISEADKLDRCDAILHCAAQVDLVRDFASLYPANVASLAALTRLGKPLHYVSTLSVLVAAGNRPAIASESDDLSQTDTVFGGYAQSKWAAEAWLRRQEVEAWIYRPGLITGDSRSGHGPRHDWLGGLIRGLVALGAVPELPASADELLVDITPVDYVAAGIVQLMQSRPGTWHLANPSPLSLPRLLDTLANWAKLDRLEPIPWQDRASTRLKQASGLEEAAALLAMFQALEAGTRQQASWHSLNLFQASGIRLASPHTVSRLSDQGISCPPPDTALLERYFAAACGETAHPAIPARELHPA